ncbi:MAG: hypothetical protein AVDCRST_MAG89-3646, partial [uncultured Gemmatimonadetes bacterium]
GNRLPEPLPGPGAPLQGEHRHVDLAPAPRDGAGHPGVPDRARRRHGGGGVLAGLLRPHPRHLPQPALPGGGAHHLLFGPVPRAERHAHHHPGLLAHRHATPAPPGLWRAGADGAVHHPRRLHHAGAALWAARGAGRRAAPPAADAAGRGIRGAGRPGTRRGAGEPGGVAM